MKRARIWIYRTQTETWVKITITEAKPVELYRAYRHNEGWSSEYEKYSIETLEDGRVGVLSEQTTDGTDCDGRLTQRYDYFAPLDQLTAYRNEYTPDYVRGLPDWERVSSSQRDYYAEAAGY